MNKYKGKIKNRTEQMFGKLTLVSIISSNIRTNVRCQSLGEIFVQLAIFEK